VSENPLVTIVMPTWNRLPYVEEAAKSVMAQTYRHWELIVIDDGSSDGTAERLNALKEPRIRVLSSPHAGHIGQLRNRGAAAGSGEFIAFLDSDDVWLPRKLELQLEALRESGAGWCYTGVQLTDATGRPLPMRPEHFQPLSGDIVRELLMFKATVATPSVLVRRSLFEAAGGYSEHPFLVVNEDYELYMRLALRAPTVAVPDALVRVRKHTGNTRESDSEWHARRVLIYELFLACNPEARQARLARRLRARNFADSGAKLLSAGKLGRAAKLFARSAWNGAHIKDWARALARGIRDGLMGWARAVSQR
jgi:glycosyltransferase involved in cell wall biosynthesis